MILVPTYHFSTKAGTHSSSIVSELEHKNYGGKMKHMFWEAIQVVLSYIKNDAERFKVFIANRIQIDT